MHPFCIEYLPRTFNSADRTENYDSDDSVAYGKRFTAIIIKTFEKLEFLNGKTLAQLTLPFVETAESETGS